MAFQGDLEQIGLADVFQNLHANQLTGTLEIEDQRDRRAYVLFEDGCVAGYVAGNPTERRGLVELLRWRQLADDRSLARVQKKLGRRLLSKALDEAGVVGRADQEDALRRYIEEETCELFTWEKARFNFKEGEAERDLQNRDLSRLRPRLEPTSLLMEAARRSDEWKRIRRLVPTCKEIYAPNPGALDDDELDDLERHVLEALDGCRDLEQVALVVGEGRFAIADVAADLLERQRIARLDPETLLRRALDLRAEGALQPACRLLEHALTLDRSSRRAREALATGYAQLGRVEDAARELKQLGFLLLEAGEREDAIAIYRRATGLTPSDLGLRERLFELTTLSGDREASTAAGIGLARAAFEQQLYDRARQVLGRVLEQATARTDARRLLAAVYQTSGDLDAAKIVWRDEAKERLAAEDDPNATAALEALLALDPEDAWAAEELRAIREGLREKRRAQRRRRVRLVAITVLLGALCAQGVREQLAGAGLADGHRAVARQGTDASLRQLTRAVKTLDAVTREHPWTFASAYADDLLRATVGEELQRAASAAPKPTGLAGLAGLASLTTPRDGAKVAADPAAVATAKPPRPGELVRAVAWDFHRARLHALLPLLATRPALRERTRRLEAALAAAARSARRHRTQR